jgi:hypothetical protein
MTQPLLLAMPDSDIAPVTEDAVVDVAPDEEAWQRFEKKVEVNKRSQIAELLFLHKGIELGYDVKWMQGSCKNYDIILERNGMRPMFVQVKHAFLTTGRNYGAGKFYDICNAKNGAVYSSTAYDVLAVYLWDRREWVLYSRAELGGRMAQHTRHLSFASEPLGAAAATPATPTTGTS